MIKKQLNVIYFNKTCGSIKGVCGVFLLVFEVSRKFIFYSHCDSYPLCSKTLDQLIFNRIFKLKHFCKGNKRIKVTDAVYHAGFIVLFD